MESESSRRIEEVLEQIEDGDAQGLEGWLIELAGADGARREAVADAIGIAAGRLAEDDEPPAGAAETWRALVGAADRLYGSGVRQLGRLDFLSAARFGRLVAESREQRPEADEEAGRTVGEPGRALAELAVSRQLRDVVGGALGHAVQPTYDAIYLYEPAGSHVRTHLDARDYEIVFHLVLEHTPPVDGSAESALIVHLPREPVPVRLRVLPGEAVALRGRGTIHSWEPLRDGEARVLTAVGFERAS